jgi:hypothetical protein
VAVAGLGGRDHPRVRPAGDVEAEAVVTRRPVKLLVAC